MKHIAIMTIGFCIGYIMIFPDDTTQPLQQQLEERDCTIENLKDSLNTIQLKIDSLE